MSIIEKARLFGHLDPESTDRIVGDFHINILGVDASVDMPYISHIWGPVYVGGWDDYLVLPEHFRNVFQLYPYGTYTVRHEPVGHWRFDLDDSTEQDLSNVDEIARIAFTASQLGDTLIHCQAGMNRSALVASRVLQLNGFTAQESVDMIREKRTPYALCNPAFERWTLETELLGSGEA